MSAMTADTVPTERRLPTLVVAAAVGLIGGAAVSLIAFYLARYGPSAGNWSFRGNGALAAYSLVPVLLTTGWCALVLRARGYRAWLAIGVGAGVISLIVASADAALLPLFGTGADAKLGWPLLITLVAWMFAAPVVAALIRLDAPRLRSSNRCGLARTLGALRRFGRISGRLGLPARIVMRPSLLIPMKEERSL